jgi:nitroreductase
VDLFIAIQERRSVRAFKPEAIPDELVDTIVDAAQWAPSAGNCQARDLIIVKDLRAKKALSEAALNQRFIEAAPINVVVCANDKRSAHRYGRRGRDLYCLLDAAASAQNILLAVHALGIGGCWIGAFDDNQVGKVLNLPTWFKPIAIIPIGYPDEKPRTPPHLPPKELIHIDRYDGKSV